ncbi:MAG: hypothetical protein WBA97_07820 [Actinophytocola sp.]|uniref:NHL domain-containing protein n=1 Tax=Actinophytocola sp. TaxID=1872138 RepID=UPI003C76FDA2
MAAVVAAVLTVSAPAQDASGAPLRPGQLVVVAGLGEAGYSGDGGPAREARIVAERISVGQDGSVYLNDRERVRRVAPDGVISTVLVAGSGSVAREVVTATAVGPDGALFVTFEDGHARQLRRIDRGGTVTVLAGESALGAAGPSEGSDDVAVDGAGNAYLYNSATKRVVRVDPSGAVAPVGDAVLDFARVHLAVGGDGTVYLSEDDEVGGDRGSGSVYVLGATGPPREIVTMERAPSGPAVAPDGTVYFVDQERRQIMRAGKNRTAVPVSQALAGMFDADLAVGPDGDLYFTYAKSRTGISDQVLRLVLHGRSTAAEPVAPARSAWAEDRPGTVHTVAGSGERPPAAKAAPVQDGEEGVGGIALGGDGTVYVTEPAGNQVRAVAPDGTVRRFAGTGAGGDTDGEYVDEAADEVVLNKPSGVATAPDGSVYLTANGRLYRVDAHGVISTIDTDVRTASLEAPRLVATDAEGTVYVSDYEAIHRIDADGRRLVVGYSMEAEEDTVPAHQALIRDVRWFAVGADGSVYFIQDAGNTVEVARPDGTLGVVTGGRTAGFAGDGQRADQGVLNNAFGVAVGRDGVRYIADTYNNRVRRVDARGVISTVAGTGQHADTGDGGPATKAALTDPTGVAVGEDGTVYVLTASDLVRAVAPDGTIRTVADLGPTSPPRRATDVPFASLDSFAVGADGTIHIASVTGLYSTRPNGDLRPVELDPPLVTYAEYGPTLPPGGAPLASGSDGSLYLVPNAALRAYPDGSVVTLLGGGMTNRVAGLPPEDWSSPTQYTFREGDPADLAVAADGTLYLSTEHGLYSLSQDGTLDVVLKPDEYQSFRGIALDPDGELYVVMTYGGVHRVVEGKTEPVVRKSYSQDQQRPKFDTTIEDPNDVAFTSDGVMFVSAGREIRRFSPNGDITTVHRSDHGSVTELVVGPGDDLYFLQPDNDQVRVLVKAADAPELPAPGPSGSVTLGIVICGAFVVLIGTGVFVMRARRSASRRATP